MVLQFCGGKLYCNTSGTVRNFFNVEILLCTVDFENKAVETVWVVQPFKAKELSQLTLPSDCSVLSVCSS